MGSYEFLNTPLLDSDYIPPTTTPDVPPDYLIQSGGGISNMHHGHPQGPYSTSAERSDVYGQSMPFQQTGFDNAVRGDMYDGTGLGKMQARTCSESAMLRMPPYAMGPGANIDYPYMGGPQLVYGNPWDKKKDDGELVEGRDFMTLTPVEELNTDGIENFNNGVVEGVLGGVQVGEKEKKDNPVIAFFILFLIFLTIDLWIRSSNSIIKKYILRTDRISTIQLICTTVVVTALLFLFTSWSGTNFIFLKELKQQEKVMSPPPNKKGEK